jgi:integrase
MGVMTMNEIMIQELINSAIRQLCEFNLSDGTIASYQNRAFKPVSDFHQRKGEHYYRPDLTEELKKLYQEQYISGGISRKTLNWHMRGIGILEEIHRCGCFEWKVLGHRTSNAARQYISLDIDGLRQCAELVDIFLEADSMEPSRSSPRRHVIVPVLLRMIYFCGLRPNEGREIRRKDVDLDEGVLFIRKNKSHRERYVPMSEDMRN